MILCSIDPGKDKSACAIWEDGTLIDLMWLRPGDAPAWINHVNHVAIEKPRLYKRHPRPGNVLDLGWGGALVAGAFRCDIVFNDSEHRCRTMLPHRDSRGLFVYNVSEWKGGVKKPPHHLRTWDKLTPTERKLFAKTDYQRIWDAVKRLGKTGKVTRYSWAAHNLWDATALGMYHLERAPKGG